MPEPLYALLYQSSATHKMDAEHLDAILETAVVHNEQRDVTGLLLYGNLPRVPHLPGVFVQWLEGAEKDVHAIYERIRSDPRHTRVETLAEGPAATLAHTKERLFPGWAMAVRPMGDVPATLSGFLNYAQSAHSPREA